MHVRTVIALLAGALLALALVRVARRRPPAGERRVYALGLLVAALVYVGFAALAGAPARWLAAEGLGVLVFGMAAWFGARRAALLAAGWAAHVAWDVLLHLGGAGGAAHTPGWYPWLCVSFDLVIAAALLASARKLPRRPSARDHHP